MWWYLFWKAPPLARDQDYDESKGFDEKSNHFCNRSNKLAFHPTQSMSSRKTCRGDSSPEYPEYETADFANSASSKRNSGGLVKLYEIQN